MPQQAAAVQVQPATEERKRSVLTDIASKRQRTELAEMLAERAKWTRIKKEADVEEKMLTEAIVPILEQLRISNIAAPDDKGTTKQFILIHGVNTTIDKLVLLDKGVPPDTIAAATRVTNYTTMQVRDVKDDGKRDLHARRRK